MSLSAVRTKIKGALAWNPDTAQARLSTKEMGLIMKCGNGLEYPLSS